MGMTENLYNPSEVYSWDITTSKWELIIDGIDSRSRVSTAIIDDKIFYMGGTIWNARATDKIDVIDLKTNSQYNIDSLPFKQYASAAVYYLDSIYTFGGAGTDYVDGSMIQNHASDMFASVYMGERVPCSKGSYKLDGKCVPCPLGSYKWSVGDQECTL